MEVVLQEVEVGIAGAVSAVAAAKIGSAARHTRSLHITPIVQEVALEGLERAEQRTIGGYKPLLQAAELVELLLLLPNMQNNRAGLVEEAVGLAAKEAAEVHMLTQPQKDFCSWRKKYL